MIKNIVAFSFLFICLGCINQKLLAQRTNETSGVLVTSYANDFNKNNTKYLKPTSLIIPGSMLLYGCLKPLVKGIEQADNDIMASIKSNHPNFHSNADYFLMWAPSASIYIMDAANVNTAHSFKEHLLIDAGSFVIAGGIGFVMREITRNMEVYSAKGFKFPSGHTTNAFRGAEIVYQELKDSHKLLSYSGYLIATTVGVLRIYNKEHRLTEVLAGAGLGILSTKLTYWTFSKLKDRKKKREAPHRQI